MSVENGKSEEEEKVIEDHIRAILKYIGEDPEREGLQDTPGRIRKSWDKLYGGYKMDPETILKTTFKEVGDYNEMVILKDIEFFSTCEHHMLSFFGRGHIGYLPRNSVVGISKLARLFECFARRMQIQEKLTRQIANSLMDHLNPYGVGVMLEAKHFCMVCRGVEKQNSTMITSALEGDFKIPEVRAEFLNLLARNN